jgi:biotin transport system substrate-specific component
LGKHITTKELILCSLFTALIVIGAFIKIPIPLVPFTLQFLFTMLAGLLLGSRLGTISVTVYVALGLVGLPIFSEGGGLGYILKPSFGYILGFVLACFVTGRIAETALRITIGRLLVANFVGLATVYIIGVFYYYIISNYVINLSIGIWPLLLYGFVLAVPGDICLCIVAAFITKRIKPVVWEVKGEEYELHR